MPALTKPEETFKQILEEMGFAVKFFVDKSPEDAENIYMQVPCLSYRLDFASLDHRVAMEVDGEYWHGSFTSHAKMTAPQFQRYWHDTQRDAEIENDGWTVFRIPASSLSNERLKPRLIKYVQALFTTK